MFTEEFKNLNITKYPYSIQALVLYIICKKPKNSHIVEIRVTKDYIDLHTTTWTLINGLKTLEKIGFIKKIRQSQFLINEKYYK